MLLKLNISISYQGTPEYFKQKSIITCNRIFLLYMTVFWSTFICCSVYGNCCHCVQMIKGKWYIQVVGIYLQFADIIRPLAKMAIHTCMFRLCHFLNQKLFDMLLQFSLVLLKAINIPKMSNQLQFPVFLNLPSDTTVVHQHF